MMLEEMTQDELLLYFYLLSASNETDIVRISNTKVCTLLKIESEAFLKARAALKQKGVIAVQKDSTGNKTVYRISKTSTDK